MQALQVISVKCIEWAVGGSHMKPVRNMALIPSFLSWEAGGPIQQARELSTDKSRSRY